MNSIVRSLRIVCNQKKNKNIFIFTEKYLLDSVVLGLHLIVFPPYMILVQTDAPVHVNTVDLYISSASVIKLIFISYLFMYFTLLTAKWKSKLGT